jgi:hypothetical protein
VMGLRGWMGTCEGCMRGASPSGPGMGDGVTRLSGGDRWPLPRPCSDDDEAREGERESV